MAHKNKKSASEIAEELAKAYHRPMEAQDGQMIQGDIWYSAVYRAVGKGRTTVFLEVCDKLQEMGYWVHS